jgi:phosphatidylglycerophosphate synthase
LADDVTTSAIPQAALATTQRGIELATAAALALTIVALLALATGLPIWRATGLAAAAILAFGWAFLRSQEQRFGSANAVTFLRIGLAVSLLAQLAVAPDQLLTWPITMIAAFAFALDAVDGWLARRRGLVTAWGARLDMDADAVLTAVLGLLLIGAGRVGAWVMLAALFRPLFVLAGRSWPWLNATLPPRLRRKLCCVLAIVLLLVAAAPVAAPFAMPLALGAIGLLVGSFAMDVVWLARARPFRSA